jgi:hypothetical protein
MGWNRQRVIAVVILAVVVFAVVKVTGQLGDSAATSTPPSCAKDGGGPSVNSQSDCLTKVGNWCQKNYPDDLACSDKVYGYVPGKPGDGD